MKVREIPLTEQPQQKLLASGPERLSNAELLAIVIGGSGDTIESAYSMVSKLGSLRGVIQADCKTFCKCKGAGKARYARLQASLEIIRRSLLETIKEGDVLSNPSVARNYLKLKMRHYQHEVFACMFLDTQHRVLGFEEMFRGTIDGASVHPREVVKRTLHYNAAAVIFVHNHPSGSHEPSKADENITRELKHALGLIDVRVLDHFVVGERVSSFAEKQLL